MSKTNNLSDFLMDLVDTIRLKKYTTEMINPQEISDIIQSWGNKDLKDVNYFDINNTILESYTLEEFQNIENPPIPTTPEGLVFTGWTYTVEDIKNAGRGMYNVGAKYDFIDNTYNAIFVIVIPSDNTSISEYGFTYIDWGDGTVTESTSYNKRYYHTYNAGVYTIKGNISSSAQFDTYKPLSNMLCVKRMFLKTMYYSLFEYADYTNKLVYIQDYDKRINKYSGIIKHLTIGNSSSFGENVTIENFSVDKSVTSFSSSLLANCTVKNLVIPNHIASIQSYSKIKNCDKIIINDSNQILNCPNTAYSELFGNYIYLGRSIDYNGFKAKKQIEIGPLCTSLPEYFNTSTDLEELYIPETVTHIGKGSFTSCSSLKKVTFNASTKVPQSFCFNSASLEYVKIGPLVTGFDSSCFGNCPNIGLVDCSESTNVLFLNGNAFRESGSCVFIVPDALYDEWITAYGWSSIASQIVKVSDYNN